MIAIDQAVAPGGDFGQQDRAQEIRRAYSLFVQTRTAIVRNVSDRHEVNRESFRVSIDKGQKSRDIELKNPIRKCLVALLDWTGLKLPVDLKSRRKGSVNCRGSHGRAEVGSNWVELRWICRDFAVRGVFSRAFCLAITFQIAHAAT